MTLSRRTNKRPNAVVGGPVVSPDRSRNLAARMGGWSAAHWKTAAFGWLAFVVVAFGLGAMVGTKQVDQDAPGPGESGRMEKILDEGFKQPVGESVLIQSRSLRVGTPAFDSVIADVVARVSQVADVQNVRSPLAPGRADQIAKDGRPAATMASRSSRMTLRLYSK